MNGDAADEGLRDTDRGPEPAGPSPSSTEIDMHYVDSLPGGRVVMPVEKEGVFGWLVVRGHISPQARQEMLQDLNYLVQNGLWRQNWQPPQAGD